MKGNLDAQRGVLNAFLPLYPYCYVYWKKYADVEASHGNKDRSVILSSSHLMNNACLQRNTFA
jgi:hypothetical protein